MHLQSSNGASNRAQLTWHHSTGPHSNRAKTWTQHIFERSGCTRLKYLSEPKEALSKIVLPNASSLMHSTSSVTFLSASICSIKRTAPEMCDLCFRFSVCFFSTVLIPPHPIVPCCNTTTLVQSICISGVGEACILLCSSLSFSHRHAFNFYHGVEL